MPRITTSARRTTDSPLSEGSTGGWLDRLVVTPLVFLLVLVSIGAGIVVLAVVFSLH